jgi:hypothetical protein
VRYGLIAYIKQIMFRSLKVNRTQSRAVTVLLTRHNTQRRHLYLMCRKCGAEDETLAHIVCECAALASLRHVSGLVHLGARGY